VSASRYGLALVVLVPLAWRRPGFLRLLRDPLSILLGLTGVAGFYAFLNVALQYTTSGTAALLAAFGPVLTAIAAALMIRERANPRTIVGLALATVGVLLVAASGFQFNLGVPLIMIAMCSYAVYTVLLKTSGDRVVRPDALALATATGVWGTIIRLPWVAWEAFTGELSLPTDTRGIVSLLVLAFVVTAPTLVLFNYGAQRVPATVSGTSSAAIPALGYLFAVAVGEPLDPIKAIGGAVALAGVLLATLSRPAVEPGPSGSGLPSPAQIAEEQRSKRPRRRRARAGVRHRPGRPE
jgi:drug/metabolite transporter (DMT)-like permease